MNKNFQKPSLTSCGYKNKIDQPGQMERSQFSTKIFTVIFANSILDDSSSHKISEGIIKNSYLELNKIL